VTHKPPYRGWEKLEPSIKLAIDSLHHAIGLKEFKSITARAVNRFALNMKGAALPDFFSCFPSVNRRTFGAWTSSSLSFSFVHRHRSLGTIPITIDLSADPAEQGTDLKITLVLECEFCQVFEYSQYGALLNEIHNLMNDAFESSITDKLREKFGEIK